MIARSGPFLAYLVNERKVRIFNTETDKKCLIDRAQGVIAGLAWSNDSNQEPLLAVLAEDGEVTIGKISLDESEEDENDLRFEVLSILSFPEIGRARGLCWNIGGFIGGKKHLAVYGSSSSDVFFIYCSNSANIKSSFFNSSIKEIKNVSVLENGTCWVSGRDGCIERHVFSGNSYHLDYSIKLPLKAIDCIKTIDISDTTYFLTLSENNLSIFTLNNLNGQPQEISNLELDIIAKDLVFDVSTRSLLIFAHGQRDIRIVSLYQMNSPRIMSHKLNPNSSIILDVIFKTFDCSFDESIVNIGVLFYFSDSICSQYDSYIIENEEFIQNEAEESEPEESQREEQISKPQAPIDVYDYSSINMSTLNAEIKLMVREAIKESLTEVIHEAFNAGIRAGFNQLSEDLMNLTKKLLSSVESADIENGSPDVCATNSSASNDENQNIRNLIAQGKLGQAISKAASIGNSRLVLEVCQKFEDPFSALDEEQLSQETLTQMFGLLSLDIDEDTEVKLDWLQEILIQIDFDSGIAECPQLSEQVDSLFHELKSLVNDSLVDGNLQKKMKTVMRLLRKFQMN